MPKPPLTASQEDYREAVLAVADEAGSARVGDIADHLGVSLPSASAAIKPLASRGLVTHEPYRLVTLTDAGRQRATQVRRRHRFLRDLLADGLRVDAEAAEANACRAEHVLDETVSARLRCFTEFLLDSQPGRDALVAFARYRRRWDRRQVERQG